MKKLFIFFIVLFLSLTGSTQSCIPNYINFYTQAEIDSFQTNYPNCTQIEGNVWILGSDIFGSDISNLNGLSVITSIGGELLILDCNILGNLTGLDNLTSIGGGLRIQQCEILWDLTGLDNLTSIGGGLTIMANQFLFELTGLNNLTSIGGSLDIESNYYLSSLKELENVTSVGASINIGYNNSLTNLTGLDNIQSGSIYSLWVRWNNSLSSCAVSSICDYLVSCDGSCLIQDNANGCNSKEEVVLDCEVGIEENNLPENPLIIYPNPASDNITIESKGIGHLFVQNICGQEILQQEITGPITTFSVNSLSKGIYFMRLIKDSSVQVRKFLKQ